MAKNAMDPGPGRALNRPAETQPHSSGSKYLG